MSLRLKCDENAHDGVEGGHYAKVDSATGSEVSGVPYEWLKERTESRRELG